MESEADVGLGLLSSSINVRRKSAFVSDDYSVQKTNDDATESKFSAIQLQYWTDKFISSFIYSSSDTTHRRDPEISRGYWARHAVITSMVTQFIKLAGHSTQIVSLGAGFDTLYWKLKEAGAKFYKFVELDFSTVTSKKIRLIRRPNKQIDLTQFFSHPISESQHSDLHAGDYHLIGVDLRQIREFDNKLKLANLDTTAPTLFIAECVLVYIDEGQCEELLKEISRQFETVSFLNYEQVNMTDTFSKVMLSNLSSRGIVLPGLAACESLETQKRRFINCGWTSVNSWTMSEIYNNQIDKAEISRIEQIELLDERELLIQLLDHYMLLYAFKDSTKLRSNLSELIVKYPN